MKIVKIVCSVLLATVLLLGTISCATPVADVEKAEDKTSVIATGELDTVASAQDSKRQIKAVDDVHVRGGSNGDTNYKSMRDSGSMELKTDPSSVHQRDIFIKFDLTELNLMGMQSVKLYVNVTLKQNTSSGNRLYIKAYGLSNDWSSDTVTWNTAPERGEYIAEAACDVKGYCVIDVSDYVFDAYDSGEREISFCVRASELTQSQMKVASSTATGSEPLLLAKSTPPNVNYEVELSDDDALNKEIWAYANRIYDEWYVRYREILAKGDYDAREINSDSDDYRETVEARLTNRTNILTKEFPTRLVSTIEGYVKDGTEKYDRYGGIISDVRYEATGYYYTTQIEGRWWVIDPLGYPCYIRGINHLVYAYSGSIYQTNAMRAVYGSAEKWAIATTRWLQNDLGINAVSNYSVDLEDVENGMTGYAYNTGGLGKYASVNGLKVNTGGNTQFTYGAMPCFNPAFEEFAQSHITEQIRTAFSADIEYLGFFTDNELPVLENMLTTYLTLDYSVPVNYYEYACAWTWFTRFTGKDNAAIADIKVYGDELGVNLYDLFRGFVYDRYFSVVQPIVKSNAPNHLYLGVRMEINGDKLWDSEWITRVAGYWVDVLCINYYYTWEIPADNLENIGRWGGKPLMITEFYSKGDDAISSEGTPFPNHEGAGWVVKTQEDRGHFYQNFTLRLLESEYCIGWLYFQYIDNDPLDDIKDVTSGQSYSNKGIIDNNHSTEIYSDLTDQMAEINHNVYSLIEFFDGVNYFK